MAKLNPKRIIWVLIVLAVLGILDVSYLYYSYLTSIPLYCPTEGCDIVARSSWSNLLGVRNEILGFIYYLYVLTISVFFLKNFLSSKLTSLLLLSLGIPSLLYSLFLVYVQAFIINNYCRYCLIATLIDLLILIFISTLFFLSRKEAES